jgi:dihydroxyacetone kinase
MSQISQESVERAVKTTANTVLEHYHYFSDLDGLAGDGDFGASLQSGFKHLAGENFEALNRASIGDLLLNISMIISKNVGGCSGPIWGTGFMRAAMKSKGKDAVTLGEFAEMLGSAIEGIQARGGAQLGDKTLLDALIPIHERLIEHAAN